MQIIDISPPDKKRSRNPNKRLYNPSYSHVIHCGTQEGKACNQQACLRQISRYLEHACHIELVLDMSRRAEGSGHRYDPEIYKDEHKERLDIRHQLRGNMEEHIQEMDAHHGDDKYDGREDGVADEGGGKEFVRFLKFVLMVCDGDIPRRERVERRRQNQGVLLEVFRHGHKTVCFCSHRTGNDRYETEADQTVYQQRAA